MQFRGLESLLFIVLLLVIHAAEAFEGLCRRDDFQCHDGTCIPFARYQDTTVDCVDGSDELDLSDIDTLGIYSSDNRVTCDFTSSSCGLQITSNATVELYSEGPSFKIASQGTSKSVFTSAIYYDAFYFFQVKYSLNIPKHCSWKVQSDLKELKLWETNNCTNCAIPRLFKYQVQMILWIRGHGEYNASFSFNVEKRSSVDLIFSDIEDDCRLGKFICDGTCRSYDILYDGVRDCKITNDEGILYQSDFRKEHLQIDFQQISCSRDELHCNASRTCVPNTSPSSIINQCLSNQRTLPFELKNASCPADFMCKDSEFTSEGICLNESFICDGIHQCPRWDDEISCSSTNCPLGCTACSKNIYRCLPSSMMEIPSTALSIDFSGHSLVLSDFCSLSRPKLLMLNLSRCSLTNIGCLSYKFPNLLYLDVSNNNITNEFITFHFQLRVNLDGNPLQIISYCYLIVALNMSIRNTGITAFSYRRLANAKERRILAFINRCPKPVKRNDILCTIEHMNLSDNKIKTFHFLRHCKETLKSLDLSSNRIGNVRNIIEMVKLKKLLLSDNLLTVIPSKHLFLKAYSLSVLDLSRNKIKYIAGDVFQHTTKIREIYLQNNQLKSLNQSLFITLKHLELLNLDNNLLIVIPVELFREQASLKILKIRNNRLKGLTNGIFRSLESLRALDMKNNDLQTIPRGVFSKLVSLRNLDLSNNRIVVHKDIFRGLALLRTLYVDEFALSCLKPKGLEHCHAPTVAISSCSYLFDSAFVGIPIWFFVSIIAFGIISLIIRQINKINHTSSWHYHAGIHMTVSDFLMGVSIIIIGVKDVVSKGDYGTVHNEWKESWLCDTVRLLSSISMDASMLIAVTFSVAHRFFPQKLLGRNTNLILLILWIGSFVFAVTSLVLHKSTPSSAFSSQQICFLLPIIYRHGFEDDIGGKQGSWMLIWVSIHSVLSVVVVLLGMNQFARKRNQEGRCGIDKALELSVAVVAVRSIFICTVGYSKMFVDVPETVHELVILIIPCCSCISTMSRVFLNTIPGIAVVFSDGYGWKRTVRNTKVLRNLIICDAPTHPTEGNIQVEEILINIVEVSTGTSLVKSTTSYRDPDVNETNI